MEYIVLEGSSQSEHQPVPEMVQRSDRTENLVCFESEGSAVIDDKFAVDAKPPLVTRQSPGLVPNIRRSVKYPHQERPSGAARRVNEPSLARGSWRDTSFPNCLSAFKSRRASGMRAHLLCKSGLLSRRMAPATERGSYASNSIPGLETATSSGRPAYTYSKILLETHSRNSCIIL